jgi:hypothetical protein
VSYIFLCVLISERKVRIDVFQGKVVMSVLSSFLLFRGFPPLPSSLCSSSLVKTVPFTLVTSKIGGYCCDKCECDYSFVECDAV